MEKEETDEEENSSFKAAVSKIMDGTSIRQAAKSFNISYTELYKYIRPICDRNVIMPPRGQLLYTKKERPTSNSESNELSTSG